jgi:broad specificity phosphatase PhoE
VRRLLLVRHAPTSATRSASFPVDEALDERGRAAASLLGVSLPARFELLCSPALRCRETAAAAGLIEPRVRPELAECDFGSWAGRSLADVNEADRAAAGAWLADPDACPHGGESLTAFASRVAGWLDRQARQNGCAVAITHGGVVKAALVHALGAPLDAFWRIDASPLSITELHAHDGRWTVTRVNCAPTPPRVTGQARSGDAAGVAGARS